MSISTHAPLAGRDPRPRPRRGSTKISTHAPLAGRDRRGLHREEDNYYFNPRAPCGARQLGTEYRNKGQKKFQPTRPLRGATLAEDRVGHGESISTHAPLAGRDAQKKNAPTVARHFNPRAPCGARLPFAFLSAFISLFQPTRPLRGATPIGAALGGSAQKFQPTRPLRGATERIPRPLQAF